MRDNLKLFDPVIGYVQIERAFAKLELLDWLRSQPQGLDTLLTSDSGGLSAGEAQLLAFARIWLRNLSLIISSNLAPDQIIVLNNGQVKATGIYNELSLN